MKYLAITYQVKEIYLSPRVKKIRAKNKKGKFSASSIILNKMVSDIRILNSLEVSSRLFVYELKTVPKMTMFVTENRITPQS